MRRNYKIRKKANKRRIFRKYTLLALLVVLLFSLFLYENKGNFVISKEQIVFLLTLIGFSFLIPIMINKCMRRKKYKEYLNNPLYIIDRQEGSIFEEQMAAFFVNEGYKVEVVGQSYDYGADLLLSKDNKKYVVQVKRYKANVGIQAVQQVLGAKEYYKANRAIVCTNSHFTKSAIELAKSSGVLLWDRKDLLRRLRK